MPNTMHSSIQGHIPSRETLEARIAENRGWLTAWGIILILTGATAIVFPFASSVAVELIIGTIFAMSGLIYMIQAVSTYNVSGFFFHIIGGLVYLAAGVFLIAKPIEGAAVLTFVVAIVFITDGITRAAVSIVTRHGAWVWMLISGVIAVVLGVGILAMYPVTALWLLGVLAGVNLLTSGMALVMVAMAASEESKNLKPA